MPRLLDEAARVLAPELSREDIDLDVFSSAPTAYTS